MYKISKNVASIKIEALEKLSVEDRLSKKDYRMLIFLMARLNSRDYLKLDKDTIKKSLGLSKKEINESLDNLISVRILAMGSDAHVKHGYRLRFYGTTIDTDEIGEDNIYINFK